MERSGGVGRLRCGEGGDVRFGLAWRLGRGEVRRGEVRRGEAVLVISVQLVRLGG